MQRHSKEHQKSIVTQTVLRVSGVFIMALVLLTVLFTLYISLYMKANILESQRRQVDAAALSVESRLKGLAEPMILLAEYEHTSRLLTGYHEKYSAEWMNSVRNVDAYLQNVNLFTDYIIDINLLDAQARAVYSLKDILRTDYPYGEQEWFRGTLAKDGLVKYAPPHGSEHMYRKNIGPTFSVINPVSRTGRVIGYIIMECDLLRIAGFLGGGEPESGYLLLDDAGGMVYPYADETAKAEIFTGYDTILPGDTGTFQDNRQIFVAHRLAANHWMVVFASDEELILRPVRRMFHLTGLIVMITAMILFAVNLYHIRIMEKPFNELIERIKSYDGSGMQPVPEYSSAPKELAIIRNQFEHMAEKMSGLIQDVYVARLKQKESELEALTNQLNPHFLYNVFQTIQTKAVLVDNREIEELIQALSMMMRYTMERKNSQVKISDEVEYIKNYLMFYKVRFPQMFDYAIECPEDILYYQTIKFVLQPVVENCFKHAFKDRTFGGVIKISARQTERDIVFEITDNGCGIEDRRLREIKERLEQPFAEGGIGIVNTNTRLRLVYGTEYGLEIDSRSGRYTKVTVRVRKEG